MGASSSFEPHSADYPLRGSTYAHELDPRVEDSSVDLARKYAQIEEELIRLKRSKAGLEAMQEMIYAGREPVYNSPSMLGSYANYQGDDPGVQGTKQGKNRNTQCPFCKDSQCEQPVECALTLPFKKRMMIWKRESLCPQKICFKAHADRCRRKPLKCSHCSGSHHRIYCKEYARNEGKLDSDDSD